MKLRTLLLAVALLWLPLPLAAGEADTDLSTVLEDSAYHRWQRFSPRDHADGGPSWLERWLESWARNENRERREYEPYERPARRMRMPSGTGTAISPVIAFALGGLAAALLLYALYSFWRERNKPAAPKKAAATVGASEALENGDALAMDNFAWRKEAERRLHAGEIRLAYRSLYLGLLSGLHSQGRIVFSRNRTNWQYVDSLRTNDPLRSEFAALTELFDRVWYGHAAALDQEGLDALSASVQAILGPGPGDKPHA